MDSRYEKPAMITFNKLIQKLKANGKRFVGQYNPKNHQTLIYNRQHPSEWARVTENEVGYYATRFMDKSEAELIKTYAHTPYLWRDLKHAKELKRLG